MEIEKIKAIIEAILFAAGRKVEVKEMMSILELNEKDIIGIIEQMKAEYAESKRRNSNYKNRYSLSIMLK